MKFWNAFLTLTVVAAALSRGACKKLPYTLKTPMSVRRLANDVDPCEQYTNSTDNILVTKLLICLIQLSVPDAKMCIEYETLEGLHNCYVKASLDVLGESFTGECKDQFQEVESLYSKELFYSLPGSTSDRLTELENLKLQTFKALDCVVEGQKNSIIKCVGYSPGVVDMIFCENYSPVQQTDAGSAVDILFNGEVADELTETYCTNTFGNKDVPKNPGCYRNVKVADIQYLSDFFQGGSKEFVPPEGFECDSDAVGKLDLIFNENVNVRKLTNLTEEEGQPRINLLNETLIECNNKHDLGLLESFDPIDNSPESGNAASSIPSVLFSLVSTIVSVFLLKQ